LTVLIDSWAWIEYFKGSVPGLRVKEFIDTDSEIIVSAINVSEVYHFLLKNRTIQEAEELINFLMKTSFVVQLDAHLALQAARFKYEKKMGLADAIVLATARAHHCSIVTGDSDFKHEKDVLYLGK
jgi:predicted nucleic acid-binding protein